MLNLLRMDLYRLKKSKAAYICLGIIVAAIAILYLLLFLMLTPQGQLIAGRMGMLDIADMQEAKAIFQEIDLLNVFRQSCLDGGFFTVVITVFFTIFLCADFKNGFIKNILSVHVNRWKYIGSKMLAFIIVDFIYLVVTYLFTMLMNLLIGNWVPYNDFQSVLFYLLQAWVLTSAMLGITLMVCMFTRSIAAGVLTSVFIGGGVIVSAANALLGLFGANKWLSYSLYMSLSHAPSLYRKPSDLSGVAAGMLFLILYTVISGIVLSKKDI